MLHTLFISFFLFEPLCFMQTGSVR